MLLILLCFFIFTLTTANVHTFELQQKDDGFAFIATGDWGGQETAPYYTKGQYDIGRVGMPKVAKAVNAKLILALGDNFYSHGISGEDSNPRFKETFEDVYVDQSLQVPWWAIAGNHDHLGNVSAQIAYTDDSERWNYPDFYYSFIENWQTSSGKNMSAEFFMIDTVHFAGMSYHDETTGEFVAAPGPQTKEEKEISNKQLEWLTQGLEKSKADYIWVGGHYPIWSVCSHGPTQFLIDEVKPLLEKFNATGYLAGHDHCQAFIQESASGPMYPQSGDGHDCCYGSGNYHKNPAGSVKWYIAADHNVDKEEAGFISVMMTETDATVTFYDHNGDPHFSSSKSPRKQLKKKKILE